MSAVRFVFALLFFLVASLAFIPAPNMALWQLKLGALEFGHWFFLLPLVLMLMGRRSVLDSVSFGLAAVAAVFFLSSSVRASLFSSAAESKMAAVFPPVPGKAKGTPFSFGELWSTSSPGAVEFQTFDFTEHDGTPQRIDFFAAQGGGEAAPCVVVVHGGGWDHGERTEFAQMSHWLARKGYAVAAIDYRLAPKATWPAPKEDVVAAVSYLRTHAGELQIDPERLVLLGRSAGGQIAEAACVLGDLPGVVGCIALYAPADMKFAFEYAKKSDILNSDKLLRQYLGGTPTDMAESYTTASPYGMVNEKTPPTLLIHGTSDELVWVLQSQRYAEQLKLKGVKHVFLKLPWATHAFDYSFHGPGGQISRWAIERFLASVTAGK